MTKNVAKMTAGQSDHAAYLISAVRVLWNSPPVLPKNWSQINLNPKDYQSDPTEISIMLCIPDIIN